MGASARTFLHIRMEEAYYEEIPPEYREQMEIRKVEVEGEEYPDDETWLKLDKEARRAWKAKMNYEYDKRHNFKK